MESRACLSTILSYAFCYEDAKSLSRRLCKKGAKFVDNDESDLLQTLCVPHVKKEKKPVTNDKPQQQKVVQAVQRAVQAKTIAIMRVNR